jgi:hypothetical protein
MPRRSQTSKTASKSRSKQTKNTASALPLPSLPKGLRAWIRLISRKSRDLAIGFGLITALSFVPPSVTEQWGSNAQRAVVLAGEIRVLVLDVALDVGTLVLDTGSKLFTEVTSDFQCRTPDMRPLTI